MEKNWWGRVQEDGVCDVHKLLSVLPVIFEVAYELGTRQDTAHAAGVCTMLLRHAAVVVYRCSTTCADDDLNRVVTVAFGGVLRETCGLVSRLWSLHPTSASLAHAVTSYCVVMTIHFVRLEESTLPFIKLARHVLDDVIGPAATCPAFVPVVERLLELFADATLATDIVTDDPEFLGWMVGVLEMAGRAHRESSSMIDTVVTCVANVHAKTGVVYCADVLHDILEHAAPPAVASATRDAAARLLSDATPGT